MKKIPEALAPSEVQVDPVELVQTAFDVFPNFKEEYNRNVILILQELRSVSSQWQYGKLSYSQDSRGRLEYSTDSTALTFYSFTLCESLLKPFAELIRNTHPKMSPRDLRGALDKVLVEPIDNTELRTFLRDKIEKYIPD